MGLVCASSAGLAFWSFRHSLHAEQRPNTRRFRLGPAGRIPGRFGGLVNKDLRYFTRLLDFYLGLLIAVWTAFYVVYVEDASPHVTRVALMGVLLFNLSAAFNYFGFETAAGLDRYGLLPLDGRDVIVSKNLSFALLVAAQLCPVILIASWRFGLVEGLRDFGEAALQDAVLPLLVGRLAGRVVRGRGLRHTARRSPRLHALRGRRRSGVEGSSPDVSIRRTLPGVGREGGQVIRAEARRVEASTRLKAT
jgi:hypothetical protein